MISYKFYRQNVNLVRTVLYLIGKFTKVKYSANLLIFRWLWTHLGFISTYYSGKDPVVIYFGFSALNNEYTNVPEATTRDNAYAAIIASIRFTPLPGWRYLLSFERLHYSRTHYKRQDIDLLIPS